MEKILKNIMIFSINFTTYKLLNIQLKTDLLLGVLTLKYVNYRIIACMCNVYEFVYAVSIICISMGVHVHCLHLIYECTEDKLFAD